jgi:hypothetical protein
LAVWAVLAIWALGTAGCRTLPFPEPKLEGAYGASLRNQTRRTVLYDWLEVRAFVHVVRVTPDLARAQAARLSELRGEPAEVAAARRDKALADIGVVSFFAAVYMRRPDWNDWDSKKESSWRIALVGNTGAQQTPALVERFERPYAPEIEALYPYVEDFHVAYRLKFTAMPPGPGTKLVIAGALGRLEFEWPDD